MNELDAQVFLSSFSLIKNSCDLVADEFLIWQQTILKEWGGVIESQKLEGSLYDGLSRLLPIASSVATRYLFWPLNEEWTLYFDNGVTGSDASPSVVLSSRLSVEAIRVVNSEHLIDHEKNTVNQYGAAIFEYYSKGVGLRNVFCANDGGKWRFGQTGEPFSFEDISVFNSGPIKNRFTQSTLAQYLLEFGIDLDDIAAQLKGPGYLLITAFDK